MCRKFCIGFETVVCTVSGVCAPIDGTTCGLANGLEVGCFGRIVVEIMENNRFKL